MKTNNLQSKVSEVIRNQVHEGNMALVEWGNLEIEKSKELESKSSNTAEMKFHNGVHTGIMHVLVHLSNLDF